jgi:predicted Zn finger-like uncharacterized protein
MIITCPSCSRKYRLEDRLIKARFQKVRCSHCGHIFVYEHGAAQEDLEDQETLTNRDEHTGITVRKKRHLGLIISLVAIALLFIAAASAYFYWINTIGAADKWLRIRNTEGQETVTKDGKIFLIKGLIANGSTKPRKYVILKAKLFDEHGTVIGEHFALAGLPLSVEEVREMHGVEIEKKVADFRLSNLPAFVLRKGGELPFSIVFPDTYTGTPKQFTVEVVESPLP